MGVGGTKLIHAINLHISRPQLWCLPWAGTMGVGVTKLTHALTLELNQIQKGRHTSLWIDVIKNHAEIFKSYYNGLGYHAACTKPSLGHMPFLQG